jgi:hypothetical protein
MPPVGFEHMIPVNERTKTAHALDREATVIGQNEIYSSKYFLNEWTTTARKTLEC